MKIRGIVKDVLDPKNYGRIRVELIRYNIEQNITPWCWPCSPFAGPGYGFYCLPVIGDEVYVEKTEDGDWIFVGFCWTSRNPKPTDGTKDVRLLRTPVGHQLKFDENGDIQILHSNTSFVILRANGDIEIMSEKDVKIYDNGTVRCVNTNSICAYTGTIHPQGSRTVFTEKP